MFDSNDIVKVTICHENVETSDNSTAFRKCQEIDQRSGKCQGHVTENLVKENYLLL